MYNHNAHPLSQSINWLNNLLETILWYVTVLSSLIILTSILIFLSILIIRYRDLNSSGLHLSIREASASGIIFGKRFGLSGYVFSKEYKEGHIICLGPSGTGKTSALLIPTLSSWKGTSFTIDISGDIYKNSNCKNKIAYEPENPETIAYDIFYAVDTLTTEHDKNVALEKIAYALVPELPPHESSGGAKFYNDGGRDIITAALIAFYHQGLDFIDICDKVVSLDYAQLFNEIDKSDNPIAIKFINSFTGSLPEHISGCKGEASKAMKLFATNETVKKSIHRPKNGEYCISIASSETHNVFFKISDAQLDIYSPLIRVTISLLLNYFATRKINTHNILFNIDELASFGKLDLVGSLRKLRKNRVRIFCLTQSLADLQMIYGSIETKAMMNNFVFKILLGATDTETQEYFAKLIGHKTTFHQKVQRLTNKPSLNGSTAKEYVIEPEELARLKNKLILLYPGGYMKLSKNYYFKRIVLFKRRK